MSSKLKKNNPTKFNEIVIVAPVAPLCDQETSVVKDRQNKTYRRLVTFPKVLPQSATSQR